MENFSMFSIRAKFKWKITLLVFILFFYLEYITYWKLHLTWMNQPDCSPPHCKKLLLISDPQIIGPEWRRIFLLDLLAIWDSDRYLRRTFLKAVNFIEPDIIVFLGDLMDQGHTASDLDFELYARRLEKLFELRSLIKKTKVILSPGDNDVGGIEDILIPSHVNRFNERFNQTEDCIFIDFIEFCQVNLMTMTMQESKFINSKVVRVALSHVPLRPKNGFFLKEVVKKIRPNLIFSGHLHTSSHSTTYENDVWAFKGSDIAPTDTQPKMYKFHEGLIHEITVPTCSYRMGVYNMGYGAAFIDEKKQAVYYNVLWLPHRYLQIFIYSITILPLTLVLLLMWTRSRRKRLGETFPRSQEVHLHMAYN